MEPQPAQRSRMARQDRPVSTERTGWRDVYLAQRHRQWGIGCPAVDMDLILVELNNMKVCAIIEYKHEFARPQLPTNPTYVALAGMASSAAVPFFAVRYAQDYSWWRVIPLNGNAKQVLPDRTEMTERQYVEFLYRIRGSSAPNAVFELLDNAI